MKIVEVDGDGGRKRVRERRESYEWHYKIHLMRGVGAWKFIFIIGMFLINA